MPNVYEIITENVIEQLSKGVIPWQQPWINIKEQDFTSGAWTHSEKAKGKKYSILNQMLLGKSGEYLTFKMISSEGGKIKEGAKSKIVMYYDSFETEVRNTRTNILETKKVPVVKYYKVWHIDDVEGIEQRYKPDTSMIDNRKEPQRCKEADKIIKSYTDSEGITVTNKAQNEAFYSVNTDSITLPLKKQFKTKSEYYSTTLHELVHSTGHKDRLARFKYNNNLGEYSLEELVAEIGACAMMRELGIDTKASNKNSESYIRGWLKALSDNTRMLTTASAKAEKAVKYINGIKPKVYEG